jgi:hypothetical protein
MTAGRASAGFLRGTYAAVGPLRLPAPGQTARCSAMATIRTVLLAHAATFLPMACVCDGHV